MIRFFYSESYEDCINLKEYFDKKGIDYELLNVDDSEDNAYELIRLTGQTALPVVIAGDKLICGFDRNAIDDI